MLEKEQQSKLEKKKSAAKGEEADQCDEPLLSVSYKNTEALKDMMVTPMQRASQMEEIIKNFKVILPKSVSKPVDFQPTMIYTKNQKERALETFMH